MSKSKKLLFSFIVIMVVVLVAAGIYFWKKYQKFQMPEKEVPVPREEASAPEKEVPASFGAQIYEQVKNPASNMPKTNPYETKTNPFEGVKTNPFENIYKNPFNE